MEMESKREKREEGRIGKGKEVKKGERGKEKQGEEVEHNGRTLLKFSKKKKKNKTFYQFPKIILH